MEDLGLLGYYTCSRNSACHQIDCVSTTGEHFKLTFLPCSVPQAVRITITGVPFDHTSSESEEIELNANSSYLVTLDHMKNGSIGFQVSSLKQMTCEGRPVDHLDWCSYWFLWLTFWN